MVADRLSVWTEQQRIKVGSEEAESQGLWPAILGCTGMYFMYWERNYVLQNVLRKGSFLAVYCEIYWDFFIQKYAI